MPTETQPPDTPVTNRGTNEGINDTPISNSKDDKFGFDKIAEHLAGVFKENDLSHGLVIGVEGAWGSGKSSLVNLALNKLDPKQVVRFSPWLVGNHSDLLHQFFVDLDKATHEYLPKNIKKATHNIFMKYANLVANFALIYGLLSYDGMVFQLLPSVIRHSASKRSERSLGQLRSQLNKNLLKLEDPIIVFIDDLDRLEPRETVEVLRLVRTVANFPNVGYILTYDPEILTTSIENSINFDKNHTFLEKIVQASFRVPSIPRHILKNWLKTEYTRLFNGILPNENATRRILQSLDDWGNRYLETPRDVVRTINSLKLNFVPVREQVDPGDALFLQLTQVKDKRLFHWIQRYTLLLYSYSKEDEISEAIIIRMRDELLSISGGTTNQAHAKFFEDLGKHLPGLSFSQVKNEDGFGVFISLGNLEEYNQDRRLASPNHFEFYFGFTRVYQ